MFLQDKITAAKEFRIIILLFITIHLRAMNFETDSSTAESSKKNDSKIFSYSSFNLPGDVSNSYLFNFFKKYPYQSDTQYTYEAAIVMSYMLFGNIYKDKKKLYAVVITPEIRLRMLDLKSNPILPPSYIIHGKFYRYVKNKNESRITRTWIVSLNHHSNGNSQNIIGNKELNLSGGSFTTNYFLLQHYWLFYKKSTRFDFRLPIGIGWEYHLPDSAFGKEIPGGMIDLLSENFGRNRIHLDYALETTIHHSKKIFNNTKIRLAFDYTYIVEKAKGNFLKEFRMPGKIPNYVFSMEANYKPGWKNGMGFFVRYRGGQDDYNVYFFKNHWQFQFGVYMEGYIFDSYKP